MLSECINLTENGVLQLNINCFCHKKLMCKTMFTKIFLKGKYKQLGMLKNFVRVLINFCT